MPFGLWFLCPPLAIAVVSAEVAVGLAVAGCAMFGSDKYHERAYRFWRILAGRAEPPVRPAT